MCVFCMFVCVVCEDLCHWARRWAGTISHQVGSPLQALNLCLLLVLQPFPGYGWLWEEAEEEVIWTIKSISVLYIQLDLEPGHWPGGQV